VGCGKCVRHCPQAIDIPAELEKVKQEMEIAPYRWVLKGNQKLKRF